jgi:hypothetical protein
MHTYYMELTSNRLFNINKIFLVYYSIYWSLNISKALQDNLTK